MSHDADRFRILTRYFPVIFLLLWSNGYIFAKIGLRYSEPLTFLALRYVCVIVVLIFPALWFRPALPNTSRSWAALLAVGLFLQAGYFAFTYLSLQHGLSAGTVALITCQQPILVGLLAPIIAGERVTSTRWAGLLLGVAGAVIVISAKSSLQSKSPLGVFFALAALLSISCGTLVEKRFSVKINPIVAGLVQYAVGLVIVAPLAYCIETSHLQWSWPLAGSLTYLVLGNSILAISLLLAMIHRGEASRVSALFFLVPPTTAIVAFFVLGENYGPAALIGTALTVVGIYLVMRTP